MSPSLVRCLAVVFLCLAAALPASAQPIPDNARKQAQAVRVVNGAIRVDGRVDEAAWNDVPAVMDFVQKEPVEGGAPTDRMEVRFAYDDNALYVGARMFSTEPRAAGPA
jgi:hypothetical protein